MIDKSLENDTALVLDAIRYKEDSALIKLAGKDGVFTLMARGVYKPKSSLKPLLIIGNLVYVDYKKSSEGIQFANSVKVIFDASPAYQNYTASCFLLFLQELANSLFSYGESFPYEEMHLIISALCEKKDILALSLLTMGVLYRRLGLNMNTTSCISCGKTENIIAYSLNDGGFICRDCYEGESLQSNMSLYVFKFAFMKVENKTLNKVVPKDPGLKVLSDLLNNLLTYFDIKELKSYPMFASAMGLE